MVFISIFCVNNLSAESQLFMIIVVLFSHVTFVLYYVSLAKYYHEHYCKG